MLSNNTYVYMDEASIPPLLKCKLCSKPFVDPVSTQNEEYFCRSCIAHILRRDYSDGNGTTNINNDHHLSRMQSLTPVTERLVLDMLDSLLVRCTECDEINIRRGQLDDHKNKACTKATVLCIAADIKCPWIGTREELKEHIKECKFEPLRSALDEIFNEHTQLKDRIENLEKEINQLINKDDLKVNVNL